MNCRRRLLLAAIVAAVGLAGVAIARQVTVSAGPAQMIVQAGDKPVVVRTEGGAVVTVNPDGTVEVWDGLCRARCRVNTLGPRVHIALLSPDGKEASTSDGPAFEDLGAVK